MKLQQRMHRKQWVVFYSAGSFSDIEAGCGMQIWYCAFPGIRSPISWPGLWLSEVAPVTCPGTCVDSALASPPKCHSTLLPLHTLAVSVDHPHSCPLCMFPWPVIICSLRIGVRKLTPLQVLPRRPLLPLPSWDPCNCIVITLPGDCCFVWSFDNLGPHRDPVGWRSVDQPTQPLCSKEKCHCGVSHLSSQSLWVPSTKERGWAELVLGLLPHISMQAEPANSRGRWCIGNDLRGHSVSDPGSTPSYIKWEWWTKIISTVSSFRNSVIDPFLRKTL